VPDDPTSPLSPLSRGTLALWGLTTSGRRGPKPAMTVQSIAAAGIVIADAEGLEAVTMAAVAGRLGYSTMALYRHVESRTDLLGVMADEALGPVPDLSRRKSWRSQLIGWAVAEAKQLFVHPWFLDIRTGSPPLGPHTLAWMDLGLQILASAGLDHRRASSALLLVDGYVRSTVVFAFQYGASDDADAWADHLRLVVDPASLPAVAAALEAGAFEDDEPVGFPSDDFTFGLEVILDGIERLLPD
jgi:AcrR family transcriptional regulator